MKNTIFIKIFGGYLLIVIVILAITFPLSFRAIRHHHIETLTANLKNLCITLTLKISPLLENRQIEKLDTLIKKLGKRTDTRFTVINPEGVVFADSEKNPTLMENHKNRIEIIQAIKYGSGTSLRYSASVKEEMLYVAMPIEKEGEVYGILRASLFLKEINTLLNNLKMNIIKIAVIIVVILLIGAFLFSRNFSRPLNELGAASRRVAQGDFSAKVFLKSRSEIKELADSFNYMTDQIKTLFTQLSNQKEELNSIISSINEGLCVIDKEGIISISNESFRKTVHNDSVKGKLYWEVLRKTRFDELIKKVRSEENSIVDEIELNSKIFLCSATFCSNKEEIVITLHDITKIKNLEKTKKDFVTNVSHELRTPLTAIKGFVEEIELNSKTFLCSATFCSNKKEIVVTLHDITKIKNLEKTKKDFVTNVSHELRTPLTAIKGFVETLQDTTNDDENQHYLNIIKRHTDRVIRIVNDLLLLSKLEGKSDSLELEKVNLKGLIENVLKIFEQSVKEKNLVLKFNVDNNLPVINADSFKLEQVFINLIDNAIKYTERGEIVLSLSHNNET
ncbi:MAG: histidine kinase dimerization/phospho-acceptor domain-containing protein, partial [Candidatus Scalindua sp.]